MAARAPEDGVDKISRCGRTSLLPRPLPRVGEPYVGFELRDWPRAWRTTIQICLLRRGRIGERGPVWMADTLPRRD